MTIRPPNKEQLIRLAQANHFSLSDKELRDFHGIISDLFDSYQTLEQMPSALPAVKYGERYPGVRPSRREDPYNAIVRRCRVGGAATGKLAGKRVGLKDNICMSGIPLTCGSLVMGGFVPEVDATVVTRLLDAGAEITAVLNMDDFAFSGAGDSSAYGPTLNPYSMDHLAGGSSGGSAAALFYDDIDITLGGDQGGSIRIPASWSGVVGMKPTYGLVPYTGIVGIGHTFDHTGPMTRTVADNALMLEVIAGKDPLDPRQGEVVVGSYTADLERGVEGLRIGVVSEGYGQEWAENDVNDCVRRALEEFAAMGAEVTDVSIPEHLDYLPVFFGICISEATAVFQANGLGFGWKGLYNESLGVTLGKSRLAQGQDLPPTLKVTLLTGSYLNSVYHGALYSKAQNLRSGWKAAYDSALEKFDVLAMPTTPMKAHRRVPGIDDKGVLGNAWDMLSNTAPFNVTGHPALSVPCGKSAGLPVGLMLIGKDFDEAMLYRIAAAFERRVDWESLAG